MDDRPTFGYRDRIYAVLARAVSDVLVDPIDAEVATHALIGAGESLLRWWVARPDVSAADMQNRLVSVLAPFLRQL